MTSDGFDRAASAVDEILQSDHAEERVRRYFDPRSGYSAETFNTLSPNEPDRVTSADLLAVSLLSVPVDARIVRWFEEGENAAEISRLLAEIPEVDIWEAGPEVLAPDAPAWRLWDLVRGARIGMGPTRTSKLMARKRPRLIPIVDDMVRDVIKVSEEWGFFRWYLQDSGRVSQIRRLLPPELADKISVLRTLDVAIWMGAV